MTPETTDKPTRGFYLWTHAAPNIIVIYFERTAAGCVTLRNLLASQVGESDVFAREA